MALKTEDPKTLAAKIKKTKELAGGRTVTVNTTPSAGMPGSGKSAMLGEFVVTAPSNKQTMGGKAKQASTVSLPNVIHLGGDFYVKSSDLRKNVDKLFPNQQSLAWDLLHSEIEGKGTRGFSKAGTDLKNRVDTVQKITSRAGTSGGRSYSLENIEKDRLDIARQLAKLGVNVKAKTIGKM